jgi:hypothetical protein
LQGRKLGSKDVSPRFFASAAKELDVPFDQLLRLIARLQMGGQGDSIITQEMLQDVIDKGGS